jgi:hypothetical protein
MTSPANANAAAAAVAADVLPSLGNAAALDARLLANADAILSIAAGLDLSMQLLGICHHLKLVWISWKFRTAKLWEDAKCRGAQDGQKCVITEYTSL